jgi:hypothetical protein
MLYDTKHKLKRILFLAAVFIATLPACSTIDAGFEGAAGWAGPPGGWPVSNRKGGSIGGGAEVCECIIQGCLQGVGEGVADDFFEDKGWRYTGYPYASPDGIYVNSKALRSAAAQVRSSYLFVNRGPGGWPDAYGVTGSLGVSLMSGGTLNWSYIFAQEDIDGPGYLTHNYGRMGIGWLLAKDTGTHMSLGPNGVILLLQNDEAAGAEERKGGTIGCGIEFSAAFFVREPFVLLISVSPALTMTGGLADVEAAVGAFEGRFHFAAGFRGLYWVDGVIQGPFLSIGLWF